MNAKSNHRVDCVFQLFFFFFRKRSNNPKDLLVKLSELEKVLNGLRTSFQYIQDYVNIAGLRIWQEELCRIFNFYVEQESNLYLKQKVFQSLYQSKSITIPLLWTDQGSTFVGKLLTDLLNLTSYKTTIFVPARQTWYDFKSQEQVVSLNALFPLLQSAIGTFGLAGIDRLLGLQITSLLQKLMAVMDATIFKDKGWIDLLQNLSNSLNPVENTIAQVTRLKTFQSISTPRRILTEF